MSAHLTISASEFKAKCLDIFSKLANRRLDQVTVTKRGKPVAELYPPKGADPAESLYGFMKGTVHIPPDFDLTAPIFEGEIVAESGKLHL
jgi:hypothetical protein